MPLSKIFLFFTILGLISGPSQALFPCGDDASSIVCRRYNCLKKSIGEIVSSHQDIDHILLQNLSDPASADWFWTMSSTFLPSAPHETALYFQFFFHLNSILPTNQSWVESIMITEDGFFRQLPFTTLVEILEAVGIASLTAESRNVFADFLNEEWISFYEMDPVALGSKIKHFAT